MSNPAFPNLAANTFRAVKAEVRSIIGDADGDWLTDAYLGTMTNHCYNLIVIDLSETCSPYITKVVTLPNLPISTVDLSPFQNNVQSPLYGLLDVFQDGVDWKQAGQPEIYYVPAVQKDKLPNYTLSGPPAIASALFFEWRQYVMYLTPLPFPIDLRVRGEFRPAPLRGEDDVVAIHPLMGSALAEQTAACAMRERANQGQMQSFDLVGSKALDSIKNQLVRSQQGTTVRLGRMNRRGCGYGSYGNGW